ncbi:MAG: pyridoxal phosphate-dependent aminotransferase [Acidaminococcus sp.]|jgi:aspartate aminotransferase/aminotransferase|nr:pyridoxal phosphate-dependent aminotransferase [Acidaminococcus sp.]
MQVAERMNQLVPSGIRKVNEKALAMERAGEKVIHFEIGRPDFDTPAYIKESAIQAIRDGKVHYTSNYGLMELRQAIADKLKKQNNIPYKAEEILVTAGLSEGVMAVLEAVLNPGDEILVPNPVWLNYINVPKLLGAVPVLYDLTEETGFQIDLDTLESKITPKTKAVVIVTPTNPTGGVLSKDTLQKLADICIKHDLMVISDEVYERIVYDGVKAVSIASLPGMKERTFTMNGFSKAYAMDGWRLGYVAAPEEWIKVLNKFHQHCATCANHMTQIAGITALRDEKDEVEEMVAEYKRRRDYAVKAINAIPGLSCTLPKGAFYIFINCKKIPMDCEKLAAWLLENAKIALVPGNVFGPGGEGYIRMSFATNYDDVVEGCRRLAAGIAKLQAK